MLDQTGGAAPISGALALPISGALALPTPGALALPTPGAPALPTPGAPALPTPGAPAETGASVAGAGKGLINKIKDPILKNIKEQVESKVEPDMMRDYQAIVVSGLKLMFSNETSSDAKQFLQAVQQAPQEQLPTLIAHAVIKMISIVANEAKGKMNVPAAFPAAIVLMCYALEFIEGTQKLEITKPLVEEITQKIAAGYMKLFDFDQKKVKEAVMQGKGGGQESGAPPSPEGAPSAGAPGPGVGAPQPGVGAPPAAPGLPGGI